VIGHYSRYYNSVLFQYVKLPYSDLLLTRYFYVLYTALFIQHSYGLTVRSLHVHAPYVCVLLLTYRVVNLL